MLKKLFCSAPDLALPIFFKPFDLYVDASNLAIGGALMLLGNPVANLLRT